MPDLSQRSRKGSWLRALGLDRKETRAWAMYDWANSAFVTSIGAAILPVYYQQVAGVGVPGHLRTAYWGYTQSVAAVIIALAAPILGAAADYLGIKKKFLSFFVAIGVTASALLYFVTEGDWLFASLVFIVGNIGFAGSEIFYESLLPHIAREDEIDRVSTGGYAIGYLGGGLLLALQLVWISSPGSFGMPDAGQASRISFVSVALWWAIFTVPLLRTVPEPERRLEPGEASGANAIRSSFARVAATFRQIRGHRHVFLFLLAFWFYNDGINTIIKMATIYGAEIGIGRNDLFGALLLVQFVGIPATFAFGALAARIGAKRGVYLALVVYTGIAVLGYFMREAWQFWVLACAVAMVQGGSQALSRSIFATIVPKGKSSEFFGFYSISGKFGNIVGPLVFARVSQLAGSSRLSILSLIVFFVGGMILLSRVDIEEGRRAAQAEDAALLSA